MNLIDLKTVNPSERKIPKEMTNSEWQQYFNILRLMVQQGTDKRMKYSYSISVNGRYDKSYFVYSGDTQWERYCKFINSILSAIRKGECDYCYYIYQISDLLRFEHDRLKAVWLPEYQCFEVSLKN